MGAVLQKVRDIEFAQRDNATGYDTVGVLASSGQGSQDAAADYIALDVKDSHT